MHKTKAFGAGEKKIHDFRNYKNPPKICCRLTLAPYGVKIKGIFFIP